MTEWNMFELCCIIMQQKNVIGTLCMGFFLHSIETEPRRDVTSTGFPLPQNPDTRDQIFLYRKLWNYPHVMWHQRAKAILNACMFSKFLLIWHKISDLFLLHVKQWTLEIILTGHFVGMSSLPSLVSEETT